MLAFSVSARPVALYVLAVLVPPAAIYLCRGLSAGFATSVVLMQLLWSLTSKRSWAHESHVWLAVTAAVYLLTPLYAWLTVRDTLAQTALARGLLERDVELQLGN